MYLKVKPVPRGRKLIANLGRTIQLWLAGLVFVALVSYSLWQGLMPNFIRLEREQLLHQVGLLEQQINQLKLDLLNFTTDWAVWDDSYGYMAQPNPSFFQENITPSTLYAGGLEYFAFFKLNGELVYAGHIIVDGQEAASRPAVEQLRRLLETRLATGIIRLENQLLLVASAQILPTSGEGPARGYLVFAKRFELGKLSLPDPANAEVQLDLEATPLTRPIGRNGLALNTNPQIQVLDNRTQQFTLPLKGLGEELVANLHLVQQRQLYQLGETIVATRMAGAAVLALIVIALGSLLMRRFEAEQHKRLTLERRYREVVQQAAEGMVLIDGKTLEILEANASIQQLLGYENENVLGRSLVDFTFTSAAELIRLCRHALSGEVIKGEYQLRHRSGAALEVEGSMSRISDGQDSFLLVMLRDIAERRQAEQTIRHNEARFKALLQNSLDMTLIIDPSGRITYATPNAVRIPQEAVGQMSGFDLLPPEEYERGKAALAECLQKPREVLHMEFSAPMPDGSPTYYEMWLQNLLDEPAVAGIVLNLRDVTERKTYQDQLEHQALHDPLTGLGNRRMLEDRAAYSLAIAARKGWQTSLVFLDVDRFKNINDTLGHSAGDELLVQLAQLLQTCTRLEDTLVRYSGDEFAILLTDADPKTARGVAERIIAALSRPLELRGHKLQVTVSIGIANSPQDGSDLTDLLKAADIAMYQAKRSGKGITAYDASQNPYSEDHLHLEASLRQAIAAQSFEFHYQPIFDLRSSRITGMESLVRWSQGGQWISPGRFIPLAEEIRLIERIDTLGLQRALEWLKANPHSGLEVSLNLSAQTLRDPAIAFYVQDWLKHFDIPAQCLTFEITETALLGDLVVAQRVLGELQKLGAKIALDDFGSGYASVAYLRHLPIDRLKLDRTMVQSIGQGQAGEQLLRAMIQLGHTLGMEVLAEGVETLEQMDWLSQNGCDLIQGYYIAKPQPVNALMELLMDKARA